jgi:pyrroloquinoline quinone (PQQ) biosynthesis protein C
MVSGMCNASDISDLLADRQLLQHPFYRRWQDGRVTVEELAAYAAEYRHFERYLPEFVSRLASGLPEGEARDLVAANLADELGDPIAHVELFERFAAAVGAPTSEESADPSPAMAALLAEYDQLLALSPEAALAGFVAYESQASGIAAEKAAGLRRDHGLADDAVSFWQHHATVDSRHGEWATGALEACGGEGLGHQARRAADAWWAFLDERDARVPA